MSEEMPILKNPKFLKSEDFYFLRETGLKYIEQLAHKLWTDYNIHDPGITLLEILCYAFTDLGFRTSFDIKDVLTREINGVPFIQGNFHTARNIFPVNPVTFNDLRKVLIDIDGVHNVWIIKNQNTVHCHNRVTKQLTDCDGKDSDIELNPLNGIYDVLIEYDDTIESEDRIVHIGMPEKGTSVDFLSAGNRGINFGVFHTLILKSVAVYAETAPGNITIRLLKANSDDIYIPVKEIKTTITQANSKIEIGLDFQVEQGGKYRLDAHGTEIKLAREKRKVYPYGIELLISLDGGYSGSSINDDYYFFYDWKITFTVSPIERELSISEELFQTDLGLDETSATVGDYTNPSGKGLLFNVIFPVTIDAVSVIPETPGTIKIQILDANDTIVDTVESIQVSKPGELNRVPVDISLKPGIDYRMEVADSSIKLCRNSNTTFDFKVKNVIEIKAGTPVASSYFFFYQWEVSYHFPLVQVASLTYADVHQAIIHQLNSCRNLCEDYCAIRDLEFENIALCADIELTPETDLNETLAEIYYRLELHISPTVKFYSIKELQDKDCTIDQIFEGPILYHGFIDDKEFSKIQRRNEIRTSDIIQIIMGIEGVKSINKIKLLSYIEKSQDYIALPNDVIITRVGKTYIVREFDWILKLNDPDKMAPNFNSEFSKVVFYKNRLPYFANRNKALDLFNQKRSRDNMKLKGHQRDLPISEGKDKNLEYFYPVQNELPAVYMTGKSRPPKSETDLRKAQSKQLKAFLLFFEQVLANYLSQLAHVKDLFSWENEDVRTYFTQQVKEIANYKDLYVYSDLVHILKLNDIIEDTGTALRRRNQFLDHLIARFAESLSKYEALMNSIYKKSAQELLIEDKKLFLREYPSLSSNRGKAFDYRFPSSRVNVSGLAHRVSRLLGFGKIDRQLLADKHIKVIQVTVTNPDGSSQSGYRFEIQIDDGSSIFNSRACLNKDLICSLIDSAFKLGANEDNWFFDETIQCWTLVNKCEQKTEQIGATVSSDVETKDRLLGMFVALYQIEGIHIIEHILLRKRTKGDPFLPVQYNEESANCGCPEVNDPYSYRITVLLPSWPERFRNVRFRQHVEETIRLETPAHIYPRICWISHCEMQTFEEKYESWLDELSKIALNFSGCTVLPDIDSGDGPTLSAEIKQSLLAYRKSLQDLIDILFNLNNVYPMARLHSCQEIDDENPTITLNEAIIGTL